MASRGPADQPQVLIGHDGHFNTQAIDFACIDPAPTRCGRPNGSRIRDGLDLAASIEPAL
jgi:hypothetical protein